MKPDPSELLRRVRQLIPTIAASAVEGARDRRVPPIVIASLREAGVFRALQPKRWGGYETDLSTYYDIEMVLASVHQDHPDVIHVGQRGAGEQQIAG